MNVIYGIMTGIGTIDRMKKKVRSDEERRLERNDSKIIILLSCITNNLSLVASLLPALIVVFTYHEPEYRRAPPP